MEHRWKTMATVTDFILLGSKITGDDDCSHEIKRCLLLGRNAMTNLDSILKSRDITFPTKVHLVKAMVFPVVIYGCESWTIRRMNTKELKFFFLILFICSEFCHTLKWNSHEFTCVPHPDPPSHLPLHPFPLGLPSAPGPSACLMHPAWAGDLFHPR